MNKTTLAIAAVALGALGLVLAIGMRSEDEGIHETPTRADSGSTNHDEPDERMRLSVVRITTAYRKWRLKVRRDCPGSCKELLEYLQDGDLLDYWGGEYEPVCGADAPPDAPGFAVRSPGPDRIPNTGDDLVAWLPDGGSDEGTPRSAAATVVFAPMGAGEARARPVGAIAGVVRYTGDEPAGETLDSAADPFCANKTLRNETVVVNDNDTLANVVVRIRPGSLASAQPSDTPLVIEQNGCAYRPHVSAALAGRPILIRNADGTLHNVHGFARSEQGDQSLFNVAQPQGAQPIERNVEDHDLIVLKCDVHPWMSAYVVVTEHPFFAVTGARGNYRIENVPAGDYVVETWHERFGAKTAEVTIESGRTVDPEFAYSGGERLAQSR